MQHQSLFSPTLKGILASFGGEFTLKIVGIFSTLIVLHQLGPYQYGLWQLLLSVVTAFGIATFPGIASMLVADVSREIGSGNRRKANDIVVRASILFVSLSLISAIALCVTAPFVKSISGINVTGLLILLSLSVGSIGIGQVYAILLQPQLEFVHSQITKALNRFAYLASVFFFLIVLGRGFDGVVYAYVIASLVPIVIYLPYIGKKYLDALRNREIGNARPFIEAVWHRGRWALLSDGSGTFISSLTPWAIGYFLGVEMVGIISVAVMLLGQVSSFIPISSVLRSVLPRTAYSHERMYEWLSRSIKYSIVGNITGGVVTFFVSYFVFPLWFPEYVTALPLFAALLITLPLRGASAVAGEWFFATKLQRELFFISTIPKLLSFVITVALLYVGGIYGYALSAFIGSDLILVARIRFIARRLGRALKMRTLMMPDAVDVEILGRAYKLISGKVRALMRM